MTRQAQLTIPDLVLLSLLAERPMHGYEANAELERRDVRDWAAVSRPQVYYSLDKLARAGLLKTGKSAEPLRGPERRVFKTNARGRAALASALAREKWTNKRERPPFLTWLALSWLVRPEVVRLQIRHRREFLEQQLERERATLADVRRELGAGFHAAVWMIRLAIAQFEVELGWLEDLRVEFELSVN